MCQLALSELAQGLLKQIQRLDQHQPDWLQGSSTHRNGALNLQEMFCRLHAQMGQAGITRIASIGGYSHLPLPVWTAVRPNSRCLSVASGKGASHLQAAIGSVMEGVEVAAAEHFDHSDLEQTSYHDLHSRDGRVLDPDSSPIPTALFNRHQPLDWCQMEDLLNPGDVWMVPQAMVSIDYRVGRPSYGFMNTSNGLASGFGFDEACCQALLEVVERHSATMASFVPHARPIRQEQVGPRVGKLLEWFSAQGRPLELFDETLVEGLYSARASLHGNGHDGSNLCAGWGCHPDPETALMRAILEANQGSTVLLSGCRDDLFKDDYLSGQLNLMNRIKSSETSVYSANLFHSSGDAVPLAYHLPGVLKRLRTHGAGAVLVRQLPSPIDDVVVVKVIVPGFEGYRFHDYYKRVNPMDHTAASAHHRYPRGLNAGGAC